MFAGKQVLTITNKIKSSDIGGLGKELTDRIGTGNYDTNRTKFNIEYVPLCSTNLASSTYKTLYNNKVEFNKNNKKINLLNGCVITSGQEYFKALGMKFEETGRIHLTGDHKGEPINKVVINDKNDIPKKVLDYFEYSHQFLCDLVGKENVVYSAVHFDEDTPHMHFYFTPVVNQVHRKVFETDENGHQLLKSYVGKDGKEKLIPIQKKDENGKNMYTIEYGKFLNSDQFWKDRGFKTSFAKIQDDYNKYINDKGFNLDRGQIGANKHHQTKAEKYLDELRAETKLIKMEYNKNKDLNKVELKYKDKISNVDTNPLLNPEKGRIIGYKEKDIINLSNYSKEVTKDNLSKDKTIEQNEINLKYKQKQIDKLNNEIRNLKSGKTLQEKDKIIENQKLIIEEKDETINYQNKIINSLRKEISELKETFNEIISNVKEVATDLFKALKRTLGLDVDKEQEYDHYSFKSLSKKINKKHDKDKSDDFEL